MRKVIVAVIVVGLLLAFFVFDIGQYFNLDYLRSRQAAIATHYERQPVQTALLYFALYVAITALSLPGAAILTLAGGAIFGLWWGTLIVSFASSLGALVAFVTSRYLLRDSIQARFGEALRTVNEGIQRDGAFYLFAMRLVPAIPFFVINLVMGLTSIRPRTFYWVSQFGMLAGTLVYVNAGTQLARIDTLAGILSPALIGSFVLLAIFPFAARGFINWFRSRQVLRRYTKPAKFDCNLVVIGAGSAGLVSAYIAAAVKAKVTLVEKYRMGGDCLHTGCVPSKALIRSAKLLAEMRRASQYGLRPIEPEFDFAEVMQRVQGVIGQIAPHDSVARYTSLGVECVQGEATIRSPYCVEIRTAAGTISRTTRAIVIATGAQPLIPPIPGIDRVDCLTSDSIWQLRRLPARLVVLGGGPIGCELAQCFARFGAQVTQIEMLPRLLMREDPDVSEWIAQRFRGEGVCVLTEHTLTRFTIENDAKVLYCEHRGNEVRIEFDEVLCAVGRVPTTQGYGLDAMGIRLKKSKTIEVDEFLQTRVPTVYACGDVVGPYQFTHTASYTAWYAAVNALFGGLRRHRVDYRVIPWCTFTDPEVARVGLNETEAAEKNLPHEVTRYGLDELDRAITDEAAHGFVKVLTVPGKDRVLGATIVGEHAAELITEFVTAMKHGIGLNKILGTIHIYPTFSEANKYVSGQWKRAHAPDRVLNWAQRYHAWMRG
jgi:pyruvate/2-oxoglutarate dehydrogenase complex dihydrolipoamide dehydrogenase (E3) component/uncharacterized membrane protein YdjX (TVP38/TMEM64 family)